jgi:outer membrane protein
MPLPASAATDAAPATVAVPAQLDLDTALSLALENNYAIRQARARYAGATGSVMESESGRLPSVTASAGYSQVDRGLLEGFGSPKSWDARIQAQQTLYSGGAIEAGVRASRAAREAAAADFEASAQAALLSVREAFFTVLLAREQVGVQEQAVTLLEEELATARSRVKAGTGSPFNELRAEVALANGQPPLIRARNAYRTAAVELLRIIGVPATEGTEDAIVGKLAFDRQEFTLEALLASARAQRPEIRRLERLVDAAKEGVEGARSGLRPSVAVVGGYGIQKSALTDDLDETVDGWNVGLQGSWPVFDGNATRGRVAQARSRYEQTRLALDEALLGVDAEVRLAFSSYREAGELVIATGRVIDQAEESQRLARARFEAGAATQLDVLQTQVALTEARTNAARALHDASIARARLERAAGLAQLPAALRPVDAQP